jgi:enoyl-CoA hydratase/carnithine racemase
MLRRSLTLRLPPKVDYFPNGSCKFTLDHPKALNAVSWETVQVIRDVLFAHLNNTITASTPAVTRAFVIRGAGPKAFCSGGDVVSIAKNEPRDVRGKFFYTEYQVNHAIGEVRVPYVALWNGIVMGGGFGVSIHGSHRVATPQTLFAMPETAIGLFPDVGGSWVLPRLPHDGLGLYLALSGARLKGADTLHAGLATSFASNAEALDKIENGILTGSGPVEAIISEFSDKVTSSSSSVPPFSLQQELPNIQKYFGRHNKSLKSVLSGLRDAKDDKWAQDLYAKIQTFSPTSVAVSFEAFQRGAACKTRAEMFEMEFRLSQTMSNHNDFYQGVDALLLTKHKNPKWNPATLDEVTDEQIAKLFEKRSPNQPTWSTRALENDVFGDYY